MEKKDVLLVEDDRDLLAIHCQYLTESGEYNVWKAEGAWAAIEILKKQRVDLVVSDYQMPDGNGKELLEWVMVHRPTLYFMFLSGCPCAFEAGVDHLNKPTTAEALLGALRKAGCPPRG